jgi:hypothetical protein
MAVDRVATRLRVTVWETPGTVSSGPAPRPRRRTPAPGHHLVADAQRVQAAALFGQRAVERRIPGMQPGDIVPGGVGRGDLIDDLVQRQWAGVHHPGPRRTELEQIRGHDRPGVQATPAPG